jgi:parallel beta-helix repeat protein
MKMVTRQSRKIIFFGLAALFSISCCAHAGDLEPDTGPAPTMKTLDEVEARIPIPGSDAPTGVFTITRSGSYYLTSDRVSSDTGIQVNVDNVTIDLNGFCLIGKSSSTYGIYMYGRTNVEIKNGTVRNFGMDGIHEGLSTGKNHRVINVRAIDNGSSGSYRGIYLYSDYNLIKNCTATGNTSHGIYTGNRNTVTGNISNNNGGRGISVLQGSSVTGNTCCDNAHHGIQAFDGSTIIGNTCYSNDIYGINVWHYCMIDQNTAFDNNNGNFFYGTGCAIGTNATAAAP